MSSIIIPPGYKPKLDIYETQNAISLIKRTFEEKLCAALNLKRVSAPLFVDAASGLNDDLSGSERAVRFDIKETGTDAVVVHSLAKWKRLALYKYGFSPGEGLYTDMNAIRRDEELDNLHSVYTDQWDWEVIITPQQRAIEYLKQTVQKEIDAICDTLEIVKAAYPKIKTEFKRETAFITAQELEDLYPSLDPKRREDEFLREHKTAFIMQIGDRLKSGAVHSTRAPDYDDWSLNGDIIFYDSLLDCAIELSSMGIRVDPASLDSQLAKANAQNRRNYYFHRTLLDGKLPLTMGGGIGQSRLCMLTLEKAHIGEVQVSVWDEKTIQACKNAGFELL